MPLSWVPVVLHCKLVDQAAVLRSAILWRVCPDGPPDLFLPKSGPLDRARAPDQREQGDAGGYAATGISSTSRSISGYQRLKMAPSSPLSVRTRVCNNKCAPSLDYCICCFLQNRLLTTSFTVDSTNPVAIAWPL